MDDDFLLPSLPLLTPRGKVNSRLLPQQTANFVRPVCLPRSGFWVRGIPSSSRYDFVHVQSAKRVVVYRQPMHVESSGARIASK